MGRIKYGYLKCPPGFKAKMRRRKRGCPPPTCVNCKGLLGILTGGRIGCPRCDKKPEPPNA